MPRIFFYSHVILFFFFDYDGYIARRVTGELSRVDREDPRKRCILVSKVSERQRYVR